MKTFRRLLSALLIIVALIGVTPLAAITAGAATYKAVAVGDTVSIGNDHLNISDIRDFYLKAYNGNTYDPNIQIYCIKKGASLSEHPTYKVYSLSTSTFWKEIGNDSNLGQTAQQGMLVALICGYPFSSAADLGVSDDKYAIAATQTLLWEFQKGYRKSYTGNPSTTTLYDDIKSNSNVTTAYWNLLAKMNKYVTDARFSYAALASDPNIYVFQYYDGSEYQPLMCYYDYSNPPRYETGSIAVNKTDPNGAALAGAEFLAVNQSTGEAFKIGPTDSKGYAIIKDIPFGTYVVTETVFPTGYTDNGTTSWTVTINASTPNGLVTLDIVNKLAKGTISVQKTVDYALLGDVDGNGIVNNTDTQTLLTYAMGGGTLMKPENADIDGDGDIDMTDVQLLSNHVAGKTPIAASDLSGWKFDVYTESGTYVETITTGYTGTATSSKLDTGKYYVREAGNTAPDIWSTAQWEFDVTGSKGGSINMLTNAALNSTTLGSKYGWYQSSATNISYKTFDGYKCLYMPGPIESTSATMGHFAYYMNHINPGTYTFSGKIYVEEARTIRIQAYDVVASSNTWTTHGSLVLTCKPGWNDFSLTFTIDKEYTDFRLRAEAYKYVGNGSSGTAYATSIYLTQPKLEPGNTATAWTDSYTGQAVTLSGSTASITVKNNKQQTGAIGVRKTDDLGQPLAGTVFGVYSNTACTQLIETITTDENGEGVLDGLESGVTYYVKEISAPDGYMTSNTRYSVTVAAGTTTYINNGKPVVNTRSCHLQLVKKDDQGKALGAGFEFGLYVDPECAFCVGSLFTDENGMISVYLPAGTYYLKELSLGDNNHILNDEIIEAVLVAGQTTEIIFVNELIPAPTGSIGVKKTDDAGEPLANVTFDVFSDADCSVYINTITTDENGEGVMDSMVAGETYYLQEASAPDGYVMDDTVYSVTVVENEITYINGGEPVVNTRMGYVQITKKDDLGTALGAGYVFGIYSDVDCTILEESITTGEDSTATSGYLAPGTYYIKELALAEGDDKHTLNEDIITVTVEPGETAEVLFVNPVTLGTITVQKTVDLDIPGSLSGWLFDIYKEDGTYLETVVTDENGTATSSQLDYGKYYVREAGNTDPDIWSTALWKFDVTAANGGSINLLRNASLTSNTLWVGGDSTRIGYCTFDGYNCLQITNWTTTTDASGICSIRQQKIRLNEGTYTLSCRVYVADTRNVRLRIYDGGDNWSRKASQNFTCEPGWNDLTVTFTLPADYTSLILSVELWNNITSNIYLTQPKLEPGRTATAWTDTYTGQAVTLDSSNVTVTVENQRHIGSVGVKKTDDAGEPLANVTFDVFSDENCTNSMNTITTNENGEGVLEGLLAGETYYLQEASAPDGYVIDDTVYSVTIVKDEITYINGGEPVINRHLTELTVIKKSTYGEPLAGAKFLLEWSEDGQNWQAVFFSETAVKGGCGSENLTEGCLVTGEDGTIVFESLYPGLQYRLKEVQAPNGYACLTDYVFAGEVTYGMEPIVVSNSALYTLPITDGTGGYSLVAAGTLGALLILVLLLAVILRRPKFVFRGKKSSDK